jgi:hypothetical protein
LDAPALSQGDDVANPRKEWIYLDQRAGRWTERLFTRDELAALYAARTINDHTPVGNVRIAGVRPGGEIHSITYSHLRQSIDIDTYPDPEEFLAARNAKLTTVLSGPNNGGKTFFL